MKFFSQNLNENNPVYSISSANKCYNHNYKSHTFLSQYYNTYYSSKYSTREFYKNKEVISDLQLIFDDIINYANYFSNRLFEWTDELEPVFVDPFTERVGPNIQLPSTPLEVFQLFFYKCNA